jgi:predicted secreted protein
MPIVAMGTTLKKGTVAIATLTSIDGVSVSADTIETTALDNEGGYRTFVTSLKDAGEVSLSGHFDFDTHSPLLDDFEARTVDTYTIEFPDTGTTTGTTWTFAAVVTGFGTSVELEDLISFEATLKVSGVPTLAGPA